MDLLKVFEILSNIIKFEFRISNPLIKKSNIRIRARILIRKAIEYSCLMRYCVKLTLARYGFFFVFFFFSIRVLFDGH